MLSSRNFIAQRGGRDIREVKLDRVSVSGTNAAGNAAKEALLIRPNPMLMLGQRLSDRSRAANEGGCSSWSIVGVARPSLLLRFDLIQRLAPRQHGSQNLWGEL